MSATSIPSKNNRGFSLIELLIVVTIISIIAAIAIPNLVQAKQSARGASAVTSLNVIQTAQLTRHAAAGEFANLTTLGNENFLSDPGLKTGNKSGYNFAVPLANASDFQATATPADLPTVWLHYYIDNTAVIRQKLGAPANATSPPLR